ncbi:MAG: phospholipid carrier-dependent glycosyltransferase [Pirellulales bacterium]|nr:phospholipid carrier-dependent glycosyltransferase [Pirellulales bacterium]
MPKNNVSIRPQAARLTRPLFIVLCLALVARVGVLFLMPGALSTDPDDYWRLAVNIAQHGTLGHENVPSAFRPPLYPLMLSPCAIIDADDWSRVAVGVLHVALGLATVGLTFGLAVRLELKKWAPLAALLVAFDPILLGQSRLIMTETAATFLATAALFAMAMLLERPTAGRAGWVGGTMAAASLCRPVFLPWMVLSFVLLAVFVKRRSNDEAGGSRTHPTSWLIVLTAVTVASCVLTPWVVRNQLQFKRPIITTTHGGYTLFLGNNRSFYDHLLTAQWGSVWDAKELDPRWQRDPRALTPEIELTDDREAYEAAYATIRSRPGIFIYSCLIRVGRLWAVMPHHVSGGRLVAAWYVLEFFLAVLGIWVIFRYEKARSPVWLWAILLVACITAVHTFYWTNMRMRAPLEPVIALAATAGLACMVRRKYSDKTGS